MKAGEFVLQICTMMCYDNVQVCPCLGLGPATDCRPGCCVSTGLRRECTVYSEHSTQYSTVQGQ